MKKNSWEDDDFRQIVDEIEEMEDERADVKAEAASKSLNISNRIKNRKTQAKALGIPLTVLGAVLKQRKLERQLSEIAKSIPDDDIELYEDASGQFGWLPPVDGLSPAQVAAKQVREDSDRRHEAEQDEGARVLEELAGVKH